MEYKNSASQKLSQKKSRLPRKRDLPWIVLSTIAVIVGARFGIAAFEQRSVYEACLAGLQCAIQSNPVQVTALLDNANAEFDFSAALFFSGIFSALYIFLSVPRHTMETAVEKQEIVLEQPIAVVEGPPLTNVSKSEDVIEMKSQLDLPAFSGRDP